MATGGIPGRHALRRFMPVVVPALFGIAVHLLGHPTRAFILWGIAAVVLVLVLAGLPVERWIARFAVAVARAVGWVASMAIGVGLVLVGWCLRLVRVDPLTPRSRRGNVWQPAPCSDDSNALSTATFGLERPGATVVGRPTGVRAAARGLVVAAGVVAGILLLDVAVGSVWRSLGPTEAASPTILDAVNMTGSRETRYDSRADHPAMADAPWAEEYFRELQLATGGYWPFTQSRPQAFDGEHIDVLGWHRESYESPQAGEDAPVVWMFGGSTAFGEGQRDEYTIASWLARTAEEEGVPIKVVNYGQRGWTHFQEMILFEQLLAEGPAPDIALFYDGANEITAQTLGAKGVPTHTLTDQYAELISGGLPEEFGASEPSTPSLRDALLDTYREHSAIQIAVGWARDFLDPPAGAATSQTADPGDGESYAKTLEDAARAVDVYERGRDLTRFLGESHQVETIFFWQPVNGGAPEQYARENLSEPTVDLGDALERHLDVFIDGGHTNEEGARIVAERIWKTLGPRARDLQGAD